MKKTLKFKTDEHFLAYEKLIRKWAHMYVDAELGDFDDMFQEASMVYLRACDTYNSNMSKFSTFLYTLLRNNFFDMIRKRNVRRNVEDTLPLDAEIGVGEDGELTSFLDMIETKDVHFDGEIMQMLYKGMSVTDIASHLGVNRSTVYRRLEKEREEHL